jgi:hypothetical protein
VLRWSGAAVECWRFAMFQSQLRKMGLMFESRLFSVVEGAIAGMLRMVLSIVMESSYDEAPLMFLPVENFAQGFRDKLGRMLSFHISRLILHSCWGFKLPWGGVDRISEVHLCVHVLLRLRLVFQ